MARIYSKKRVSFGLPGADELPRYEYHRTLRQALDLSATSHSFQAVRGGTAFQWDNIAPETALVILQDAKEKGIDIQQEVREKMGAETYNDNRLNILLSELNSNPDYKLFCQKLALTITHRKSRELTLDNLKPAGIGSTEKFHEVFTKFLLEQQKLSKNFPNFTKVKDEDSFNELLEYMVNNPLFDKFLTSYTQRIAYEFNKGRSDGNQVKVPAFIDKKSLVNFLKSVSYDVKIGTEPALDAMKKNTLYLQVIDNDLQYTILLPNGVKLTEKITEKELGFKVDHNTSEQELKSHLPAILKITSAREHTSNLAVDSTATLRDNAQNFLQGDYNHDLFLAQLPAVDYVKDAGNSFTLYKWLEAGNLSRLKDFLADEACQRHASEIEVQAIQAQAFPEMDEEFRKEINAVKDIMKDITRLVASLEDNRSEQDNELDKKIADLTKQLKSLWVRYANTPIRTSADELPTSQGHFEKFVRQVIFNSNAEKVMNFSPDSRDKDKIWKIDLVELTKTLVNDKNVVQAVNRDNKQEKVFLYDADGVSLLPADVFREQLKENINTQLKNNVHNYHAVQSYQNDNLELAIAPVGFRGGNLTDELVTTKPLAKKFTRLGEYSADSHLLVGQENNIGKHEVRSGAAATLIAATGVDGTRSVTDNYDIALKFGGTKEVKIMYVLRGKEAFHTQSFLEPMGKNVLSEMSYTHVKPSEYVMTILYDKNNVILDVIPGNLSGEIDGISDMSRGVLAAGIEFYNNKKNADLERKPIVKLPDATEQKSLPSSYMHHRKTLMGIIQAHKDKTDTTVKEERKPAADLGRIRIDRENDNGNKKLVMKTLRQETKLVVEPDGELEAIPEEMHFKPVAGQLQAMKQGSVAHYNMRHILSLKDAHSWTSTEKRLQIENNRFLQPNFIEGDLDDQVMHAGVAQEGWLTSVLVPRMSALLLLNVAACLITDYQVDIEDVNKIAQDITTEISFGNKTGELSQNWDKTRMLTSEEELACRTKAQERVKTLYPGLEQDTDAYNRKVESCYIMEVNKHRKATTREVVSEFLDKYLDEYAIQKNLEKKPVVAVGDNRDFVFLGPAASGKSTISSQYISQQDRMNYVSLATDDYRGIYLPYSDDFEKRETEQVFTRTQDSAYLVSELVIERMNRKNTERPNVIVDGVTYKPEHRKLVEQNQNSTVVCACLDDMPQVVVRCYDRAKKEDAGSADKGRFVNTTDLINGHKTASINLVRFAAPNTTVDMHNTNIPRGTTPPKVATLDTHGEKTLTISNEKNALLCVASFFNKARVNVDAKSDDSLFLSKMKKPVFQIDSLFAVMEPVKKWDDKNKVEIFEEGFKIVLNGDDNKPCLAIKKELGTGQITMDIIDPDQIKQKLAENSSEKQLLQMMLLYGKHGSLKGLQRECMISTDVNQDVHDLLESGADIIPQQSRSSL